MAAGFNIVSVVIVYFIYPESGKMVSIFCPTSSDILANRSLEDIDYYFSTQSGLRLIIPIKDKASKSTNRPQEFIEAEKSRALKAKVQLADSTLVNRTRGPSLTTICSH